MSLCFWPKMQVTIFIGSASSVLFLTHFCFCLSRAVIISGPYIICWVFCCLIKKFWRHTTPNLFLLCFWQKWQGVEFYWLGEFCATTDSLLLLIRLCACIMRVLVHVLCGCCSSFDFFGHACQDMMCREISRPPGPTNHACLRSPVPSLPLFVVIVQYCTHTHPYTPIYTHL